MQQGFAAARDGIAQKIVHEVLTCVLLLLQVTKFCPRPGLGPTCCAEMLARPFPPGSPVASDGWFGKSVLVDFSFKLVREGESLWAHAGLWCVRPKRVGSQWRVMHINGRVGGLGGWSACVMHQNVQHDYIVARALACVRATRVDIFCESFRTRRCIQKKQTPRFYFAKAGQN